MKNKKLLIVCIVSLLVMAVFPVASLANEDDMQVVYVQVPADWENPSLWAWADNGDNAFDEWPGGQMLEDDNNEGWYYIWLPTWATNIIVNANEGTVQTSDMPIEGNTWVIVTDAETVDLSSKAQTVGEPPEYVEMVVLYAQVPADWEAACIWAWSDDGKNAFDAWPGGEMIADGSNEGWSYIYLPVWATNIIINANEGTVQTSDMPITGDTWAVIVDAETVEISTEALTTGDTPEYVEKITVYAKTPTDWETINLWAWSAPDGTNAFSSWPGGEMKLMDSGWAKVSVPNFINSIIVNGNEGTVQTPDLSVEVGVDMWIAINDDLSCEVTYEDPALMAETVRIHTKVPEDWVGANLWAWSAPDGTNVFSSWPGEPLEDDGNGWLVHDVPNWVNSIIVNANEAAIQTSDISIEVEKDVWVVVQDTENYTLSYEEPSEDVPAEKSAVEEEPLVETKSIPVEEENNLYIWITAAVIAIILIVVIIIVIKKKQTK